MRPTLQIVLWKWVQPNHPRTYLSEHVNVMCRMLHRSLAGKRYRIICITDDPSDIMECETFPLWPNAGHVANATKFILPSCYRRLKLYDAATQFELGFSRGDRIVSLDLDTLVTGRVFELLTQPGDFFGWELKGTHHPRVFNGSLQAFDCGSKLQFIWDEFDEQISPQEALKAGFLGSDQAWLSYKLVGRKGCFGIGYPEIASYPLHVRIQGTHSAQTKLVFFHGRLKPWDAEAQEQTSWIKRYWS